MLGFFDKSKSKKKESEKKVVAAKKKPAFRTPLSVFYRALEAWEKENNFNAPLWLNYATGVDALAAQKELNEKYHVSSSQTLGAILVVDGDDARRLVSVIKRIEREKVLETKIYNMLVEYTVTGTGELLSLPMDDVTEAQIAKRLFDKNYRIREIVQDKNVLFLTGKAIQHYIKSYTPTYASR